MRNLATKVGLSIPLAPLVLDFSVAPHCAVSCHYRPSTDHFQGKGKLVDILASNAQLCCHLAGGNNAAYTIVANGVTYDFHSLPSDLVNSSCINLIGTGCIFAHTILLQGAGDSPAAWIEHGKQDLRFRLSSYRLGPSLAGRWSRGGGTGEGSDRDHEEIGKNFNSGLGF